MAPRPIRAESAAPASVPNAGPGEGLAPSASLEATARVAVTLLRVVCARVYRARGARATLIAAHPAGVLGRADALGARALATRLISAAAEGRTVEADSGSHLGVALPPRDDEALALVVSDPRRHRWSAEDLRRLLDVAAIGGRDARTGSGAAAGRAGAEEGSPGKPHSAAAVPLPRAAAGGQAPLPSELYGEAVDAALVAVIRESIVGRLHVGALHAGDRLPSIRQTARAFAVTPYLVLQAYAELELEGLVERRERSGMFVAEFELSTASDLPETGEWLAEVLAGACRHQVKIPLLPDLIRRWTSSVPVRCLCIESCFDSRYALSLELAQQFGIDAVPVTPAVTSDAIAGADLVITTAYHAAEIGPLATDAHRAMLIATVSPLILSAALGHLRERDLTVVCVDPAYGERLRGLEGGAYRERVRVVTVHDSDGLAALDRSEAVLLTPAARQHLDHPDFRLVAPMHPSYSLDFARKVAEAVVAINLRGGHG